MHFSWATDLDPKGANSQIKEAIDPAISQSNNDGLGKLKFMPVYCFQLLSSLHLSQVIPFSLSMLQVQK